MMRIKRIFTDPGAQRLEKPPEHGEAIIVSMGKNENNIDNELVRTGTN
jgi:hypothetical protein